MGELKTRIKQETKDLIILFNNRPKKQTAKFFLLNNKISDELFDNIKCNLEEIYNSGYGFKLIGRELNTSYSKIRTILIKLFKISTRTGYDVVPFRLKQFRSEKAKLEGFGKEWPIKYVRSNKGIQGYYWNRHFGKYCWLRSSYEYIYAKFLDRKNIKWNSEIKYFILEDGRKYLPDFFIYDGDLVKYVVEIKGGYKIYDRGKQDLFKEYPVIVVRNIKDYLQEGNNLRKELILWKQNRVLKLPE